MPKRKTKTPRQAMHAAKRVPVPDNTLDDEQIQEKASEKLPEFLLNKLKIVTYYITEYGSSLHEASLLARLSDEELSEIRNMVPEIDSLFIVRRMKYKYKLLDIVHGSIKSNRDEKMALNMLETQFPEEYSESYKRQKQKYEQPQEEDVLQLALAVVRRKNTENIPVKDPNNNPVKVHEQ